ncbi:hypothetical protein Pcinc_013160 [Petrolisthes cinctipes]|uniref:Uncharacterized protein n=1 Tax=Petrolisthes cinctipes TaxID=88211 RepID=A0AAE1G364_PETCI|nr:hypothetical protein Pcinc_013160 [Petrolisthes cinctipes]
MKGHEAVGGGGGDRGGGAGDRNLTPQSWLPRNIPCYTFSRLSGIKYTKASKNQPAAAFTKGSGEAGAQGEGRQGVVSGLGAPWGGRWGMPRPILVFYHPPGNPRPHSPSQPSAPSSSASGNSGLGLAI